MNPKMQPILGLVPILTLILISQHTRAEECNFHATLALKDTFYLAQPYSTEINLDISPLIEAFEQLETSLQSFTQNLDEYSNETALNGKEPLPLIPFSDTQNVYKIDGVVLGKNALKKCYENGKGSLISLNAENRAKVAEILEQQGMEKTPFLSLPFYSLLSFPNLETFDTPENFGSVIEAWLKSPPFVSKANVITYPSVKITKDGVTKNSTPEDFETNLLCVKRANLWDLPATRKTWMNIVPKLKSAIAVLSKLEQPFDTTLSTLNGLNKVVRKVSNSLKITLPESFENVLTFLDKLKHKNSWEQTTLALKDQSYSFIKSASKLARMFNLDPNSFTKIGQKKTSFELPSFNNINWRDYLNLDLNTYGVIPPIVVTPLLALAPSESETKTKILKVQIKVKIFNRKKDLIKIYSVKPNVYDNKMTTIKSVIASAQTKMASEKIVEPSNCVALETELHKVCHQLPIFITDGLSTMDLATCADALLSQQFSLHFEKCPRVRARGLPYMYRSECGPEKVPTVVVNSDRQVLLDFVCDGTKQATKLINSKLAYIPTNCEVQVIEGASQKLTLPQLIPDMKQDPTAGDVSLPDIPVPSFFTEEQLFILFGLGTFLAVIIIVLFIILSYKCCKKCKCRCKCRKEPAPEPPPPPFPSFLQPFIPIPDLRQIVELREINE